MHHNSDQYTSNNIFTLRLIYSSLAFTNASNLFNLTMSSIFYLNAHAFVASSDVHIAVIVVGDYVVGTITKDFFRNLSNKKQKY